MSNISDLRDQFEELLKMVLSSSGWYYTDWKFWIGLIGMIVQTFISSRCCCELGPNTKVVLKWIEVFSFDLVALSLVQCYSEAGIWLLLLMVIVHNFYWMTRTFRKAKPTTVHATDIYEDLRRPGFLVATVFFGQSLLFMLYVVELFFIVPNNAAWHPPGTMESTTRCNYRFWFCGVVAIQMSAMFGRGPDSQLGAAFDGKAWGHLFNYRKHLTLVNEHDDNKDVHVQECSFWMRMCASFMINAVMRDVIAYTTPLILMVSSEDILDFIQNALAVVFITNLDTTSEGGLYRLKKSDELLP